MSVQSQEHQPLGQPRPAGCLVVATEHRFTRAGGHIYSTILTYDRLWARYLEVFEKVLIVARVREVDATEASLLPAGGPGVSWMPLPHFVGPWQYLRQRATVSQAIVSAADSGDAFMLRVPGTIGTLLWRALRRRGRPYGVEVAADPYEVFAPGVNRSVGRPFFRFWFTHLLRAQCREAVVAAYVTRHSLQRRYPGSGLTYAYSDVELREPDFATLSQVEARIRRYQQRSPASEWTCVHIGTMAQRYKRQDALIRAVAECRQTGLPLRLKLVGSGEAEQDLRALAHGLGVERHVEFAGQLPAGDAIRAVLDDADLFVLPSQTEGLPRVVLEAMARGLPCLASDVGGLRELLDPAELFGVQEIPRVASYIRALVQDSSRLARLSRMNVERARAYHAEALKRTRLECYSRLAEISRSSTALDEHKR